ncbi:glyceraldehyde-3-phosphate dehydrogenase [Halomonas elongata]|uniref:Glyceraldehyde-3-phosphate dehydrogenase n=1 Tax=Halomonas elongata TaxID=2746 RepID=A0A1B8NZX7_HALEL|nr:glyceraldehyde-3-phosphate dehydrogenase [Halomonas elongata]
MINVSLVDLTFTASRETSIEEVNAAVEEAAKSSPVMRVNAQPLVSIDFNHDANSSTFDANHTRVNGRLVKVMAWYDNEWASPTACSIPRWPCTLRATASVTSPDPPFAIERPDAGALAAPASSCARKTFMLPDYGWLAWTLIILSTYLTGVSKGGFAGGFGTLSVPLMALAIGPIEAAGLLLPLLLVMDLFAVRAWWGQHDATEVRRLLPGMALGSWPVPC